MTRRGTPGGASAGPTPVGGSKKQGGAMIDEAHITSVGSRLRLRPAAALLLLGLILACGAPGPPPAARPPSGTSADAALRREAPVAPRKLHIAFATEASLTAPLWVTKDQGLFDKYGLDVDLTFIRGGATIMQSMIAGSIDLALSGASATITSYLGGANPRFLATTSVVADQGLITNPAITRPEQLRGKLVGLSVSGGSGLPQLLEALRRVGLSADDIQMIDVPAGSDRVAGLSSGALDAIMEAPTLTAQARRLGFNVLIDLAKEGVPNQGQSVVALQSSVEQNPAVMKNVLRAFSEGIHVLLTDQPAAEQSIGRWSRIEDPGERGIAYHAIADYLQRKPYPSPAAVQTAINAVALQLPEARAFTPEMLIDDTFLRELDDEGFFERLGP